MRVTLLAGVAMGLTQDQLQRIKEVNDLKSDGGLSEAEYKEYKQMIVEEGKMAPRRALSDKKKCLAAQITALGKDAAAAAADANNAKNVNSPAVAAIMKYIVTQPPKVAISGGSSGSPSGSPVVCESKFRCNCKYGGGVGSSDSNLRRATCNTKACMTGWTLFDNYAELKCQGDSCNPDRDNAQCCSPGKWYEKGTYIKINGATATHSRNGDWDSARASAWITTGRMSVVFKVTRMSSHMMIGAIKKDGVQWNQHVNSGKANDAYPDGWVWYSGGGRFYNYSPVSGSSFKRWGGPNAFRTNDKVRIYVDAEKRAIFAFCNGTQVASWTNCRWGQGVSVGASFHDVNSSLTIMTQNPGDDEGYGAWREWGSMMERKGPTIYLRSQHNWETARATAWITTGDRTVTMRVTKFTDNAMLGCFRRDYISYEQHPHSGNTMDAHPEAWVWYAAGGRFYNYSPYGGSFARKSTATNAFKTNEFVQVKADAGQRACYVSWRKGSSGSFTLIAQWTNLNIGRGMTVGLALYKVNDAFTIVKEGKSSEVSHSRSACGQDACLNGWTPHDNARELFCRGSKCSVDQDNETCCHIGKWLDKGTYLKITNDNTIVHTRNGDWDSARASAWVTSGRQSVTFKVALMKANMMIGGIRKDGVQWNNHVHSSRVGDAHPDGWVWYSASGRFYNYVPLSGSFRRWGGPNAFKTNDKVRVYVDADNKQVFIFCNGTQVASWSKCSWGSGVSVGASFYEVDSSLVIIQNTPGQDNGFGAWREWGMMMERQGETIFNRVNGWETARATEWISKGQRTVSMKLAAMSSNAMIGCYRKDYMVYDQHPNSGGQGDIYPEGWVWYTSGGRFYNYSPYGGSFKRVSTATNTFRTNQFIRIKADASGRGCFTSWRAGSSGGYTLIAQWTNLNIGRGMAVGISFHENNNAMQIVEEQA